MGVTILDIAKTTGFSKATVARAFSNPELVRPGTLKTIRSAAEEMGYHPNALARAMITKRTGNLAFIIYGKQAPVITNPFYGPVLESVVTAAQRKGYSIFIVTDEEMRLPSGKIMLEKQVDGTIFASQPDLEMLNLYKSKGTPVVLLNHASDSSDFLSVVADDYGGVSLAMNHLYSLGRRRIALIEGSFTDYIRKARKQSYLDALKRFGLPYDERMVALVEPHVSDGAEGMRRVLRQAGDTPPDAVLCMNDIIAAGAMKALLAAGMRIPEDIAVTGYDDSSICAFCYPEMTSIDGGKERMGEEAVRMLCALIDKKQDVHSVKLDVRLSIRGSTIGAPQ